MALSHHRVGAGEPLLLVHGLGSEWAMWQPVLPALGREREVIAIDLPGFGGSPPLPSGVSPTAGALAQAVAAFLDELGWQAPHLAGNSLGGWIALELAKLGRARSVVAISPAGFWSAGELRFARASLRVSRWGARALRPFLKGAVSTAAGRTLLLSQMYARPWRLPAAAAAAALEKFATAPAFEATFQAVSVRDGFSGGERIACPVTLAWGSRDRILFPRQVARAHARLPEARAVSLRGCGHVPTWDDPEQVVRLLLGNR